MIHKVTKHPYLSSTNVRGSIVIKTYCHTSTQVGITHLKVSKESYITLVFQRQLACSKPTVYEMLSKPVGQSKHVKPKGVYI